MGYFKRLFSSLKSLAEGLWLTLKVMLRPSITLNYPHEKFVPFEQFRGVLLFDAETCIACNLCVKACPSQCIVLENATAPGTDKKIAKVAWYSIDFGKCNFCRLCQEACPTKPKSVWHSLDYELVFNSRDEMVRCWKHGFDVVGKYYDSKARDFKDPPGQISIQSVPARKTA